MQAPRSASTISRITCDFANNPNQVQSIASRKTETFDVSFSQSEACCTICVQCTLPNALQVLGVASDFDFDVAAADPPWMNALEDGALSVHSKRSRTPVQRDDRDWIRAEKAAAVVHYAPLIESSMRTLHEMGMIQVYGEELCQFTVERYMGNLELALEELYGFNPYPRHPLQYLRE
jgi:hypothetical protein